MERRPPNLCGLLIDGRWGNLQIALIWTLPLAQRQQPLAYRRVCMRSDADGPSRSATAPPVTRGLAPQRWRVLPGWRQLSIAAAWSQRAGISTVLMM